MQSLILHVRRCLFTALAVLAPAMPVRADVTYLLNDYPAEQAGGTLSGSITVVDTAADDGLLQAGEIVHWTFTVTRDASTHTVDSATTPLAAVELRGDIMITGAGISIPQGAYNRFTFLDSPFILEWERLFNFDGPCNLCSERYRAEFLDGGERYWDRDSITYPYCAPLGGTDPWLIATNPNPPPSPGACCNPATGGCLVLSVADCATLGLTFVGSGITCAAAACNACPADFNGDGAVTVPDIFSFLGEWFAGCP